MTTIEVLQGSRPTTRSVGALREAEGCSRLTAPPWKAPVDAPTWPLLVAGVREGYRLWGGLAAMLLLAGLVAVRWWQWLSPPARFQDLAVYRAGAAAVATGGSPYAVRPQGGHQLVFTYPPFAAVVFEPLAGVRWPVAVGLLLIASLAAYLSLTAVTGHALDWDAQAVGVTALLGLVAEPVLRTVQQGQVNLLLAAMIAVDALLLPPRFRGVLTGVAAGVKVVPAAFVLFFVARGDGRAALTAAVTGAATAGVGWLLAPNATVTYWTSLVWDTSRSGGGGYPDNQSLVGALARALHDDTPPTWLTLPLQVGVLTLAYRRARAACRGGDDLAALLAVAVGALLASPVSWSHHWVWCIPLLMVLVQQSRWAAVTVGVMVFALAPLALSQLGALAGAPEYLWQPATAVMPAFGLWWLIRGCGPTRRRSGT